MNKFAEMTTFVSVVDAHSFSEAARRLGTTKSQVSQRIQQLERRLGRVLLNRTRPLSLTDPGRTYYEHACRLLQELEQAEASVLDADDDLRGQLRLRAAGLHSALPGAAAGALRRAPSAIAGGRAGRRSLRQPPGTALRHGPAHGPAGRLLPGGAADHRQPPPALRQSRLPGAALACRSIPRITGARRAGLLQPRARRHALSAGGRRTGLVPHPGEDAHRPGHQLLEGARAGLGLAILPSFLAADALLAGELLPVLPGYSPDGGQVSVVYRKTQRTPRKILVLGQFLEEEIGDPAPWDRALVERGLLPPG